VVVLILSLIAILEVGVLVYHFYKTGRKDIYKTNALISRDILGLKEFLSYHI
jgi:hypothetical protein